MFNIKKILKRCVLAFAIINMSLNACYYSTNIAYAEVIEQTVEAVGEYRIGDNDTRAQAKEFALTEAKRIAAEKVLVYVESRSVVENFEAMKDRIETYTKAKMQILSQQYSFLGEESTLCQASIVAAVKIDIDEIERQQMEEQRRKEEEQRRIEEEQRAEEQRKIEEEQRAEEQRRRENNKRDDAILQTIISVILGSIK